MSQSSCQSSADQHQAVPAWGLEKAPMETDHQGRASLFTTLRSFKSFTDSSVGKESACNAGDPGSIPGSGRSAGEGIGTQSRVLELPLWLRW